MQLLFEMIHDDKASINDGQRRMKQAPRPNPRPPPRRPRRGRRRRLVTAGGRVLCVCALGRNVTEAQAEAYSACRRIHWNGAFTRSDIGQKAVDREREST